VLVYQLYAYYVPKGYVHIVSSVAASENLLRSSNCWARVWFCFLHAMEISGSSEPWSGSRCLTTTSRFHWLDARPHWPDVPIPKQLHCSPARRYL